MINGKVYDFESIKLTLPIGLILLLESIDYSDKKDMEVITGQNGMPVGIGRGEYSGTCDIEMGRAEFDRLNVYAIPFGGFYNMAPIPIIVLYANKGELPTEDTLIVKFSERSFSGKKGDKNLNVQLKGLLAAPIVTNGIPAYTSK